MKSSCEWQSCTDREGHCSGLIMLGHSVHWEEIYGLGSPSVIQNFPPGSPVCVSSLVYCPGPGWAGAHPGGARKLQHTSSLVAWWRQNILLGGWFGSRPETLICVIAETVFKRSLHKWYLQRSVHSCTLWYCVSSGVEVFIFWCYVILGLLLLPLSTLSSAGHGDLLISSTETRAQW